MQKRFIALFILFLSSLNVYSQDLPTNPYYCAHSDYESRSFHHNIALAIKFNSTGDFIIKSNTPLIHSFSGTIEEIQPLPRGSRYSDEMDIPQGHYYSVVLDDQFSPATIIFNFTVTSGQFGNEALDIANAELFVNPQQNISLPLLCFQNTAFNFDKDF